MGVGYDSLKKIRSELNELASDQSLFPRAHFPVSDSGESVVYRLSEDDDHRFALYGSVGTSGKEVPPHNHTTWAVIVGVHGQEFNRFYERTDDRSVPSKAVLKKSGILSLPTGTELYLCLMIFIPFQPKMQNLPCIFICTECLWIIIINVWSLIRRLKVSLPCPYEMTFKTLWVKKKFLESAFRKV